jgi:hypothetical protein
MVIIFRCETLLRAIASLACGPVGIGSACLYKTRKFGSVACAARPDGAVATTDEASLIADEAHIIGVHIL